MKNVEIRKGEIRLELKDLKSPYVVAEIGCNHKGNVIIAKKMIEIAALYCGVKAVKFQKRCIRELLSLEEYNAPHPAYENSYGETYGKHREYLEFDIEIHRDLMEWCNECGVTYSASVWDVTSAKEITALNPKFIKIPSAANCNYSLLSWLCDNYDGEMHISLGMTTRKEEERIVRLYEDKKREKDLVLYACTSGYPIEDKDACLLEIKRMKENYSGLIKKIGYSGHHLGIVLDGVAYTLGAEIVERHFTLSKGWKGTDHKASLLPDDMKQLVENLERISKSLKYKDGILDVEKYQRKKLKTNLF